MFKGVLEKSKRFFKNKGRRLRFANQKPVKIQVGIRIDEVVALAIKENIDNYIMADLRNLIANLEQEPDIADNPYKKERLEWAKSYLEKFEKEVDKIRNKGKTSHELKTILKNISLQSDKITNEIKRIPVVLTESWAVVENTINKIEEQVLLYNQSIKSYTEKGGKDTYQNLTIKEEDLTTIYESVAESIEKIKDDLVAKPTNELELKNRLSFLEKFADKLVRFAPSKEKFNEIRTKIDKKIADKKKAAADQQKAKECHELIKKYTDFLKEYNKANEEIQKCINCIEEFINKQNLTEEDLKNVINYSSAFDTHNKKKSELASKMQPLIEEARSKYSLELKDVPEVKQMLVKEAQFSKGYEELIEGLEKQYVIALHEIYKDTTTSERKDQLFNILKAINEVANTIIQDYSVKSKIDIVVLNNNRRSKRNDLLKKMFPKQNVGAQKIESNEELKRKIQSIFAELLEAYRKADIQRNGEIVLNPQKYLKQIIELHRSSLGPESDKILNEARITFEKDYKKVIELKCRVLTAFQQEVKAKIQEAFRTRKSSDQFDIRKDHNEWLSKIEHYQILAIFTLDTTGQYKELIPNGIEIIKECIEEQNKIYNQIKNNERQSLTIQLSEEFVNITKRFEHLPVDDKFESFIVDVFEKMKRQYSALTDFKVELALEKNMVIVLYQYQQYNYENGVYLPRNEIFPHVIMSQKKFAEYIKYKKEKVQVKETNHQLHDLESYGSQILINDEKSNDVKVTKRPLRLAAKKPQVVSRTKNLILSGANFFTLNLIDKGLKIKYNENLRNQLRELNAKLSLVHKDPEKYRSRTQITFDGNETEQNLQFKGKKENFDIADYKLEVRLKNDNPNNSSDLLYDYHLDNISDELQRGRHL